jgi:WD40 repeat protein
VITAYDDNSIIFYNADKGTASAPLISHTGLVRAAAFAGDGSVFATGGRDSTVIIWRNNAVQNKIHFDARIKALAMSTDNSTVAVGCEDGTMYLLSISSSAKKSIGNNAPSRIQSVAYSRQGNDLAFGSSNSTINVFRSNGSAIKTIADNTSSIDFMAMDENLKVLVSGSANRIIHFYSLADLAQKPIVIKDITSAIVAMSLSADGKVLVACADNSVRQFDVSAEHLQSALYGFINRNLTTDEWNTYVGSDVTYQKIKPD